MSMPKMWTGEVVEGEKPMPFLRVDEEMNVSAVNSSGETITYINQFNIPLGNRRVKDRLQDYGYSTSWAEWDDEGRFVRLKEDSQ